MYRTSVSRLVILLQSISLAGFVATLALVATLAWTSSREAGDIAAAARTDQALFEAMIDVRQQIAQVLTVIISEADPGETISARQAIAHAAFDRMHALMVDAPVDDRDILIQGLTAAWQDMGAQEPLIDREIALPRARRDLDRLKPWSRSVQRVVRTLNHASLAVRNEVRLHDPFVSEMLQIRHLAWRVRDRFGGLCSLLRRSVASASPMTTETAAYWNRRVGGYRNAWMAIDALLSGSNAPSKIVTAVSKAQAATESVQERLEALIQSFDNSGNAVMPAQEFTGFCNGPFDEITDVAFLAMAEAVRFAERRERDADLVLVIVIAACVAAVAISVLTIRTVLRRFSSPIRQLMVAVSTLSSRNIDQPLPAMPYPDEFGRLAEALREHKRTQKNLIQTEKMAALGRLVAGVAHEVNTPIGNSLIAATALALKTKSFRETTARGPIRKSELAQFLGALDEGVQMISANTQRAHDLLQGFKQVAVDQTTSTRRDFDLANLMKELEMALSPQLKRTPHKLVFDVPNGLLLDTYPGPLQQVLTNLVVNALVHAFDDTPAGTILILAEPAPGDFVRLVVSDNGSGIPDEHIARIFDPFFTTKLGKGGTGLGLNIVYGIVSGLLGGSISVRSGPDGGTFFTIEIPMAAPILTGEKDVPEQGPRSGSTTVRTISGQIALQNGSFS